MACLRRFGDVVQLREGAKSCCNVCSSFSEQEYVVMSVNDMAMTCTLAIQEDDEVHPASTAPPKLLQE